MSDEPTRVVATEDMSERAFGIHLKLRHPGRRAVNAPPDDREGHDEMHQLALHAHYHAEPRVE